MKYLLLFALIAVIWWRWQKSNQPTRKPSKAPDPVAQKMLVCAHCGVHFPEGDGFSEGGLVYCSEAHCQAARDAGQA